MGELCAQIRSFISKVGLVFDTAPAWFERTFNKFLERIPESASKYFPGLGLVPPVAKCQCGYCYGYGIESSSGGRGRDYRAFISEHIKAHERAFVNDRNLWPSPILPVSKRRKSKKLGKKVTRPRRKGRGRIRRSASLNTPQWDAVSVDVCTKCGSRSSTISKDGVCFQCSYEWEAGR